MEKKNEKEKRLFSEILGAKFHACEVWHLPTKVLINSYEILARKL